MEGKTGRQFRMKYGDEHLVIFCGGNEITNLKEDPDIASNAGNLRRADKREGNRIRRNLRDSRFDTETIKLRTETVPFNIHINQTEVRLFSADARGQEDGAGTGPPDFHSSLKGIQEPPFQIKDSHQSGEACTLPPRKDQSRNIFKIRGFFDSFTSYAQAFQMIQMFANPSLKIKNADSIFWTAFAVTHREEIILFPSQTKAHA